LRTSVTNAASWRSPLLPVGDVVIAAGTTAQAHDLVHRRDALRARLDALEAVGAVVDPLGVLGEVLEALELLRVARVADEAVGLGQGGGADEARVDLPSPGSPTRMRRTGCRPSSAWTSTIAWAGTTYSRSGTAAC